MGCGGDVAGAREWGGGRVAPRPPRACRRVGAAELSPPPSQVVWLMAGQGAGVAHRGWVKDGGGGVEPAVDHPRWSPPPVEGGPAREGGGGVATVRGQTRRLTRGSGATTRMHIVTPHPPYHLCFPFLFAGVTPCSPRRVHRNKPPVRRQARVASGVSLPPRRDARAHTRPASTTVDPSVGVNPAPSPQGRPARRSATRLSTAPAPTGSERPPLGPFRRASTVLEAAAGNPTSRPHRGAAAAARGHRRGGAARGGGSQSPSTVAPAVAAAIGRPPT